MASDSRHLLAPALTASAVVLAGLLASQLGRRAAVPEASASMVSASAPFTLMSASVKNNEEALLVIDNATDTLLVYTMSNRDEVMVLADGFPLTRLFEAAARGEIGVDGDIEEGDLPGGRRARDGRGLRAN